MSTPNDNKRQQLISKLKELFQLDQPDLDFGLYRIMHAKSAEITQFLEKDLLPQVQAAFALYKTADKAEIEKELAKVIAGIEAAGMDPSQSPKVKELQAKLQSEAVDVGGLEGEVYDHLLSFFRRYYSEGDFLSRRVYKPGVYAIPYEGEEIKLHSANADQYYIKTSEYLRDYAFRLRPENDREPLRVHFRLSDVAEGEHGNVKASEGRDRVFVLASSDSAGQGFITEEGGGAGRELVVRFEYRPATLSDWPDDAGVGKTKPPGQKELTAFAVKRILGVRDSSIAAWIGELERPHVLASGERADYSRIEAHLRRYTARNTFDYFIHKDLGTFLRRELDFYIKNEVMHLDDVESESAARVEQYLSKIKVIRRIAGKIIEFLAQLEDFQKALWLKKKFAVQTSWCIRIDCVPNELIGEVTINEAQRLEWVSALGIEAISGDLAAPGYSAPLTREFLAAHPSLMIDTRYFGSAFVEQLLASFECLDDETDGVLIHSDNFQALSLMQARYQEVIKCFYIDPPYNTGQDGFVYKDSFKSSSWASMIGTRLALARQLLCGEGLLYASINEIERSTLEWQLRETFGLSNRIEELIWVRDTVSNNSPAYSTNHEYIEVFAKNRSAVEANKRIFRETRDGFLEVSALVKELNARFASIVESKAAIAALYQRHKLEHIETARNQGESIEDAKRSDPWKGLYPYKWLEYRDSKGALVDESKAQECQAALWVYREVEPSMPAGKQSPSIKDPQSENYRFYAPKDPNTGSACKPPKRGWAFPEKAIGKRPSFEGYCEDNRIVFKSGGESIPQIKYFLHEVETVVATSVVRQYADGEPQLEALFGAKGLIDNPKPPGLIEGILRQTTFAGEYVADFFAGSGTTGHAVVNRNRQDGGRRKFILVEVGQYFDTVLLPRLKKICYSPEWEDGKPKRLATSEEVERSPRILKVVRLESYEDSLSNLDFARSTAQQTLLEQPEARGAEGLREEYLLSYMLAVESRGSQSLLNISAIADPTAYKLKVKRPSSDESKEVHVDLLETFNWLIGLKVKNLSATQAFNASFARDSEYRLTFDSRLKQDADGPWWFRTVTGTLPDGRAALVVWRKLTGKPEEDNLVLDEWFTRQDYSSKDSEFDLIYVNGGNNLENLKAPDDTWKVRLIEEDFHRLMFATEGP
ncbi:site-specific DNA-methyltransferase [Piscinibacter sp.]|uniref:site-specific DNA-methyltransferase n=1 Tax=Piscinibacter sp. TaxID=1903157 RepID=UPI001DABA1BD|nr:site-specific DNA-methyltransferase [Piscinibacter sp.]MBK7531624.1 site-specific DNA-methyltransferase [Piscinibacter sp.]